MEIGQKVTWNIDLKVNKGIFMQIVENNKAEVICYNMNGITCHLRVFIDVEKLKPESN